jgi:pre-mRNA-splicing factor CDC5/CEF1
LKAAGIEVGKPKRKIKGIDYNREIPFQKKPPPGFYEVDFSHEKELSKQSFKPLNLTDIDQKRKRETEDEEAQKDHDKKKKKKEKTNLPDVIMQINKLNDPDQVRTKTKLVLPAPILNDADLEDLGGTGKIKPNQVQQSLKTGLKSLPAPQNEYKITMPELPPESQLEKEDMLDADASDLLREQQRLAEEKEQERLRLRSQTLQRDLPRPFGLPPAFADYKSQNTDPLLQQVDDMLRLEVVRLIAHEAVTYPFKQSRISNTIDFDEFTEKEIKSAQELIEEELKLFTPFAPEEVEKVPKEIDDDLIYVPSTKNYQRASKAQKKEKIKVEAITFEFEALKALMGSETAKVKKLESKVDVYNKGYQNRANTLLQQIQETATQIDQTITELGAFRQLKEFEDKAIQQRVAEMTRLFQIQEERERINQQRYMDLITEKENLKISVR